MNYLEKFYDAVKKEMTAVLATSAEGSVTMRVVSPVYYEGDILIFTSAGSRQYNQLKENPNCCISAGCCFAEAAAEFFGGTMLDENQNMRDAYTEKFPEAFDESVEFGGRYAEFILLHPTRISGWAFENDIPVPGGVPTVPFEIDL